MKNFERRNLNNGFFITLNLIKFLQFSLFSLLPPSLPLDILYLFLLSFPTLCLFITNSLPSSSLPLSLFLGPSLPPFFSFSFSPESHVFGLPSDWIYDIRYELLIILCPPPEFWDTRHKLLCPLVHT